MFPRRIIYALSPPRIKYRSSIPLSCRLTKGWIRWKLWMKWRLNLERIFISFYRRGNGIRIVWRSNFNLYSWKYIYLLLAKFFRNLRVIEIKVEIRKSLFCIFNILFYFSFLDTIFTFKFRIIWIRFFLMTWETQ